MGWKRLPAAILLVLSLLLSLRPSLAAAQPSSDEAIESLQQFYARLYGDSANFESRLGSLVSVVSLSKYAGEPIDAKLIEAMDSPDALVAMAAWDALAARADLLSDDHRRAWQDGGFKLATGKTRNDVFLGDEMRPLLLSLAGRPVEKGDARKLGDLIERAVAQNDASDEAGRKTLQAAGQAVLAWGDSTIVNGLVRLAQRTGPASERTQVVLAELPNAPGPGADRNEFRTWAGGLKLEPAPMDYQGGSIWFDEPIVITDSEDDQFRKEVELGKLNISGVDVVFAIDATGSLTTSNAYIQQHLAAMGQALSVVSNNIRVGICYYRHEVRPDLQTACCREALEAMQQNKPRHFLIDTIPLTGSMNELLQAMNVNRLPQKSGHKDATGYVGAPAAGLEGAYAMLQQMSRPTATRVIVLQADTDPTDGTMELLETLAGEASDNGVVVPLLIRDKSDANKFQAVAQAGSDRDAIVYRDDLDAGNEPLSADGFIEKPFGQLTTQIVSSALPSDYADRGPVVVQIVLDHVAASQKANAALIR